MAERKLDADPLLNPRMKRHLKNLGLKNVDEYRRWCKDHGANPTLSKNIRQVDQELRAKKSDDRAKLANGDLAAHLKNLGFDNDDRYRAWCRSKDLSDGLHKSVAQRRKEIRIKEQTDFEDAEKGMADIRRSGRRIIGEMLSGEVDENNVTHPGLGRVYTLLQNPDDYGDRRAFFARLLSAVLRKADFIDLNPVIDRFGGTEGNTYIDGMHAMACHADQWIRAPESWNPGRKGLRGRFGELARHLFTLYPVPEFMDSAWFAGSDIEALEHQRWFIHIGHGENIRTAGLPMNYTKRMAHLFLQAPDGYSVVEALRWGQVLALGGSPDLARHINTTRLGRRLENEAFWISVIHFFVNNPMLDSPYVELIVEYIYHRKFAPGEDAGDPPDPGFSMKGRRPEPLLELVDVWNSSISRERRSTVDNWESSGIPPYELVEEEGVSGHLIKWTIAELLTRKAIFEEGKAMKHCVRSYVPSCMKGVKSVWSLRREDVEIGATRRVLTIAVKNDIRKVIQARGKCNAMAGIRAQSRQETVILRRDEALLQSGRRIMKKWGEENHIVVPRYT